MGGYGRITVSLLFLGVNSATMVTKGFGNLVFLVEIRVKNYRKFPNYI
jgi:hypothetical protein